MPLHPRFVHFPVAFLFAGSVILLLSLMWARKEVKEMGWASLLLGWLTLFPAIGTGLIDQGRLDPTPEVTGAVNRHITGGIALLVIYGYLLYTRLRQNDPFVGRTRWLTVAGLVIGLGVLVITGEIGGQLAYVLTR